jgi:hypothetical protein
MDLNCSQNANGRLTITLQTSQEIAFRPQTLKRLDMVYPIDHGFRLFVIASQLKRDHTLAARRKKFIRRQNFGMQ